MTNSNSAGIPYVVCTIRHAPISEKLRTVHGTWRPPRRIFPNFSTRRRGILRRLSISWHRPNACYYGLGSLPNRQRTGVWHAGGPTMAQACAGLASREPLPMNIPHSGNRFWLNAFWPTISLAVMLVEPIFLRENALRCSALARSCPDLATSHALEALAAEWMERAAELEKISSLTLSSSPPGHVFVTHRVQGAMRVTRPAPIVLTPPTVHLIDRAIAAGGLCTGSHRDARRAADQRHRQGRPAASEKDGFTRRAVLSGSAKGRHAGPYPHLVLTPASLCRRRPADHA